MIARVASYVLALVLLQGRAAAQDRSKLGDYYSSIPLYRTGQGSNVVSVGVGTPEQQFNLTFSTNVEHLMVVTTECDGCVLDSTTFNVDGTESLTAARQGLSYTLSTPGGFGEKADLLTLDAVYGADILYDSRGDVDRTRTIAFINDIQEDETLPGATAGYFGVGIEEANPDKSFIPNFILDTSGAVQPSRYHIVGMDVNAFSRDTSVPAGEIHWGSVPEGRYNGDFNWIDADPSKAGGWAVGFDFFRVGGSIVQGAGLFASIDPAYDSIIVPSSIAESIYSSIPEATRDTSTPNRWNLPCTYNISLVISINSRSYNIEASQLVQPRDVAGRTCWGSLIAWTKGSVPDVRGEVRLGTPFMQGVYSALYYSSTLQQVGIAGKPNSVNDFVVRDSRPAQANGRVIGAVVGSILGVLLILFAFCYSRNHNTFQSFYYRAIRRQHQGQINTAFLHSTLPPPPMMVNPMGMGMMPPPMYHPPMGPPMPPMGMGMPPIMPPPMRGHYMHPGAMQPPGGVFGGIFNRPGFMQRPQQWQAPPPAWAPEPPSPQGKVRFGQVQAYDPPTPYSSRGYSSEQTRDHENAQYDQPQTQAPGIARYHPDGRPPPADWIPPVPEPGRPLGMPRDMKAAVDLDHSQSGKRRSRGFWKSGRDDGLDSPTTPRHPRTSIWRGLVRKREEAAAERQGLQTDHGYV